MSGPSERVEGYFAYGANMNPAILARRGLAPLDALPGRIDDYALSFTAPGLALVEPGFATVRASPGDHVHGVFYKMTATDLAALDRFEHDQERFEVTVHTDRGPVQATTYRAHHHREGLRPSRRYLAIVVAGARLHALPDPWVEWLQRHPSAYVPVLSELMAFGIWLMERGIHGLRRP